MRYRRQRSNPGGLDVLDNPMRVLGTDLRDGVEGVAGIVATAFVNDKIFSPLSRNLVAGFRHANNSVGQFIDAGTTFVAAQVVGFIASRALGQATGRRMAETGGVYAVAKAVTGVIPNLSVSAQYPDFFPGLALFGGGAGAVTPALPAGTSMGSSSGAATYFTSNPRPVASDADVGY